MNKKNFNLFIILSAFLIFGCSRQTLPSHVGKGFINQNELAIELLTQKKSDLIRRKTPVKISGKIKYYDNLLGAWAFVDDGGELIYVDFAATTPNIRLPQRRVDNIILEGYLREDNTILNGIALVPYGYEIPTGNYY